MVFCGVAVCSLSERRRISLLPVCDTFVAFDLFSVGARAKCGALCGHLEETIDGAGATSIK